MQNTNLLFGNRVKCVRWLQYTSKRYKRCCKWEIVRKILEYDLENLKKNHDLELNFVYQNTQMVPNVQSIC